MAINNFISTVWSENLYQALDKQYVAVANCCRDYEGDIREKGSAVKICGLEPVVISDYEKNVDLMPPSVLSDNARELVIDQAKYFNFIIDDVDRAQSSPKLMDMAIKNAANALANEADKHVFSLYLDAANMVATGQPATKDNILDMLLRARTLLSASNVANVEDIVYEVSPAVAELIMKAKIDLGNNSSDVLEAGCIGNIAGCKIYVSNNIVTMDEADGTSYKCLARTKRSIAFAEQLSEIEAYRPENRFGDAVKGLHLYGAKVVYPQELVLIDVLIGA